MGVYVKAPFIELLKGYERHVSEINLKATVEIEVVLLCLNDKYKGKRCSSVILSF